MKRITTILELVDACNYEEPTDFYISVAGGWARSSKNIMLLDNGNLLIVNEIDEVEEELSIDALRTKSNIGEAITNGAFYQY